MDKSHRDLLNMNLVALTTDLDPCDVVVPLIEMGVLTMEERNKILKIPQTRNEKVVELISILQSKGPTAFEAFMGALQNTNSHLYDLLSRKQQNSVRVNIQADANPAERRSPVEHDIFRMISLRNVCLAAEAIGNILAELGRFGRRILDITEGSVVLDVECPSVEALDDLWELCQSGKLARMFQEAIVTDSFLQRHKVKSVSLCVAIHSTEYSTYRRVLLSKYMSEFKIFSTKLCLTEYRSNEIG
ncbi:hypothetical protein CAPTEDRAFT_187038 [Capitella teleta]|uniref:CARD domain-containing protein n=1 Tax=Capitella teleta TaxID=283909 RepID=R7VCV3_CAPTE|nr:hypothetical protein CAPTEDRAFT_187038 [Capitella teleta]|eukprot:ELU13510.1 hypothetical protein CAPTEDRAFT_187038 [Capitella teleta]